MKTVDFTIIEAMKCVTMNGVCATGSDYDNSGGAESGLTYWISFTFPKQTSLVIYVQLGRRNLLFLPDGRREAAGGRESASIFSSFFFRPFMQKERKRERKAGTKALAERSEGKNLEEPLSLCRSDLNVMDGGFLAVGMVEGIPSRTNARRKRKIIIKRRKKGGRRNEKAPFGRKG